MSDIPMVKIILGVQINRYIKAKGIGSERVSEVALIEILSALVLIYMQEK